MYIMQKIWLIFYSNIPKKAQKNNNARAQFGALVRLKAKYEKNKLYIKYGVVFKIIQGFLEDYNYVLIIKSMYICAEKMYSYETRIHNIYYLY